MILLQGKRKKDYNIKGVKRQKQININIKGEKHMKHNLKHNLKNILLTLAILPTVLFVSTISSCATLTSSRSLNQMVRDFVNGR